jgi:hypothetical protein
MKMIRCRLCLLNAEDAIEIYNDEGKGLNVAAIISKHLPEFWQFKVNSETIKS